MYRCTVTDLILMWDGSHEHSIAKRSASDHEVLIVLAELKTPNMPSASKGIYGYAFQS